MTDPPVHVIRLGDEFGRGGFYNMLFPGGFDRAKVLLPLLGAVSTGQFGRFRDCWLERDEVHGILLRVYTRNGGDNREDQVEAIDWMRAHPLFVRDGDDAFDRTYASWWFRIPPDLHASLGPVLAEVALDPVDMDAKWQDAIDSLKGSLKGQ